MPNWCYNSLTVNGKSENLKQFLSDITLDDKQLSLSSLFPVPSELLEYTSPFTGRKENDKTHVELSPEEQSKLKDLLVSKYGTSNWYDWQQENWGSKWGDSDTCCSNDTDDNDVYVVNTTDNSMNFTYSSPWCPINELMAKISERYTNLIFQVVSTEEGDAFAVWENFHKGICIGRGEGLTDPPKEVTDLLTDDDSDEYYEALNDWQNARTEKLDNDSNANLEQYQDVMKKEYDKMLHKYKVRMMLLKEEMNEALLSLDPNHIKQ